MAAALLLAHPAGRAQEPPAPLPAAVETPIPENPLDRADALWTRRSEGSTGGQAAEALTTEIVEAYRKAAPAALTARWKLMRALYFQGEHATTGTDAKKAVFDQGKVAGDEALALVRQEAARRGLKGAEKAGPLELVTVLKGTKEAADVQACFLWAAINWGKWALVYGKTAAARKGAAGKIRDLTQAAIQIDPGYDDAAAYRVLGRLHHQTPAIPFITGWASRDEALKFLTLAVRAAPKSFFNRLYLAEALWDYEPSRRDEAVQMLRQIAAEAPRDTDLVEDRRCQEDAAASLKRWKRN